MKVDVITLDSGTAGSAELDEAIFSLPVRQDLLQRAVRWQLAKRQAGTHKTKGRSEIALTGKKFVKQKGSGGARHGDRKAPQFRGGGKAFGPVVRSHAHEGKLVVLDHATLSDAKTKGLAAPLAKLGWSNALIIDGDAVEHNFARAAANIPYIDVLPSQGANVYDILRHHTLVLTKAAVEKLGERLK